MREWVDQQYTERYGKLTGVDEAGRGPLAGPVVAAAVYLNDVQEKDLIVSIPYIDDSKKLSEKKRTEIFNYVKAKKISFAIGIRNESMIDCHNILMCTNMAMNAALKKLNISQGLALIDGKNLQIDFPNIQLIKGDSLSLRIALASNIAKVIRDRIMRGYSKSFPEYDFEKNKGYGTKHHLKAISVFGPTPFHRLTFRPLYEIMTEKQLSLWLHSGQIDMNRYQKILLKFGQKYIDQKKIIGFS